MLNAEKFKDEILETLDCDCEGFGVTEDNKITMCRADSFCCICSFLKDGFCSREAKDRWLLSEYKEPVKLSRLEYEILKWEKKEGYKYIARTSSNSLFFYANKPNKLNYCWVSKDNNDEFFGMFNKLFQFVRWEDEEPTLIEKILNNCEVVDNEDN